MASRGDSSGPGNFGDGEESERRRGPRAVSSIVNARRRTSYRSFHLLGYCWAQISSLKTCWMMVQNCCLSAPVTFASIKKGPTNGKAVKRALPEIGFLALQRVNEGASPGWKHDECAGRCRSFSRLPNFHVVALRLACSAEYIANQPLHAGPWSRSSETYLN